MKSKQRFVLFIAIIYVLIAISSEISNAATGEPFKGRVIDKNGFAVEGVEICVFESDLNLSNTKINSFSSHALQCTKSDKSGFYSLSPLTQSSFTIIGRKKDLWFTHRNASLQGETVDTIKTCGSLYFFVKMEKAQRHDNINVSLIGTPFSTKSDRSGIVQLPCISPGTYTALLKASQPGYLDVQCSLRIVSSVIDTFTDTLLLPYTGIAAISITKSIYDSVKGVVELEWSSSGSQKEFRIYRNIKGTAQSDTPYVTTSMLRFSDSLKSPRSRTSGYSGAITQKTVPLTYIVTAVNTQKQGPYVADTATITVTTPVTENSIQTGSTETASANIDTVKKVIKPPEPPVVNAGRDTTANLRDEVTLHGTAYVNDGNIVTWEWSIGKAPFRESRDSTINVFAPATVSTPVQCIVRVTADNGLQSQDTVLIYGSSSPPVITIKGDTTVGIFDTIQLNATIKDNGTIIAMGWDIGKSGKFTQSNTGSISIPPQRVPIDSLMCIFRAIDDDGEVTYDTAYVKTTLTWQTIIPTPQIPERKGHALVNFNGLLWIIGGNRSDIWNSSDGVQWQKITDAAPFGERFGHTATAFNGQLFVIGGKASEDRFTNDIWSSSDGKNWRKVLDADFLKRHYHTVTEFNDRLWMISGLGEAGYESSLNDIWSSEDGVRWKPEKDTSLFSRRYGHGAVVLNNEMIISGGFYEGFTGTHSLKDTWKSSDGVIWKQVRDTLPGQEEIFHSFLSYDNRIWSIGGYCTSCEDKNRFTDILYSVDGSGWVSLNSNSEQGSRLFNAAAVFNNRIYISPSDASVLFVLK